MFERVQPESVSVDSRGIIRFLEDMKRQKLHMHSLMILRHGKVLAETSFEPWSSENLHMLFSLSKSFTSLAVGFAVQDGLLRTEDRLVDFFPDLLPAGPCENMKKVTVRHLLTMNTGHHEEPRHETDRWEEEFLRSYVEHEPGSHFLYNTFGTYMLSAVVQKATGKKLLDWLREKLMDPLDMSGDIWTEESPSGVATGGYGLNVRIEDVAKLGQFCLQEGMWEGRQLLNPQWIRDARTPWSDNSVPGGEPSDWGSGYGYQFWMCMPDHVYRGDGAFGQFCVVLPDQDMVVAINSGVEDMGAVLKSVWKNILPAVDPDGGIPADPPAVPEELKTPARWEDDGEETAAPVPEDGWIGRYVFFDGIRDGESCLTIRKDAAVLDFSLFSGTVPFSPDEWRPVIRETPGWRKGAEHYMDQAYARAARQGDTLILHICFVSTPFEQILRLTFTGHGVRLRARQNVGMGPTDFRLCGYKAAD